MTDQLRAAAEAALEALLLTYSATSNHSDAQWQAISDLRAALAEPECCCGEPTASGVVHRQDGPCYMAEPVRKAVADMREYALSPPDLERFAALVAAAEREACAKLCDEIAIDMWNQYKGRPPWWRL